MALSALVILIPLLLLCCGIAVALVIWATLRTRRTPTSPPRVATPGPPPDPAARRAALQELAEGKITREEAERRLGREEER